MVRYSSYDQWDDEEDSITADERDRDITEREIEEVETRHLSPLQRFFWRHGAI